MCCSRSADYLTLLEEDVSDDGSAQGAGGIGGVVLSQCPQTGFTEDVVAGVTHVRTEVHIQAHSADVTVSVPGAEGLVNLAPVAAAGAGRAAAAAAGWVPR